LGRELAKPGAADLSISAHQAIAWIGHEAGLCCLDVGMNRLFTAATRAWLALPYRV